MLAAAALVVALAVPAAALAFDNLEPLAAKQWYLTQDQAWTFWPTQPKLYPVKLAVIDSGIDGTHPEFAGRVVAARSFVGGSPFRDDEGHGTFVAGEIAANPFNGIGMAGLAFNAQLMIAKVVGADGNVSLAGEVAAIHWAVDNGARSARFEPRHLLAARAGRRRIRVLQGRCHRRSGRERAAVTGDAMELRPLPLGSAARHRRQRDPPERLGAGLLESRHGLQRHRSAGRRDVLDDPAAAGRIGDPRLC